MKGCTQDFSKEQRKLFNKKWKKNELHFAYKQEYIGTNPKLYKRRLLYSKSFSRVENYKLSKTPIEFKEKGGTFCDFLWDLERDFIDLKYYEIKDIEIEKAVANLRDSQKCFTLAKNKLCIERREKAALKKENKKIMEKHMAPYKNCK
jgi:hypothetical protein